MFKATVIACLVATVAAGNLHERSHYEGAFYDHIQKFSLKFEDGAEFLKRLQIFADNLDIIEKHNSDKTQTFTMGQNKFSHLTHSEFVDQVRIGGARPPNLRKPTAKVHSAPEDTSSLADSVDWVAAGAVTEVKDQGNCGSCWSFSTTGALEGAYQLKFGTLKSFSEQELVSCDTSRSNNGCNGGWMDDAFVWVQKNGGLAIESDYPYTSGTTGKSGTCQTSGYTDVSGVAPYAYTDVQAGSVSALMSAVSIQPVSIAIQANQLAFQMYKSGVLTGKCGQNLDHGVLLVGYGTEDGIDYWKVKNSWSDSWGEDGYIKIERSDEDLCGVLDAASFPNL